MIAHSASSNTYEDMWIYSPPPDYTITNTNSKYFTKQLHITVLHVSPVWCIPNMTPTYNKHGHIWQKKKKHSKETAKEHVYWPLLLTSQDKTYLVQIQNSLKL